MRHRFPHIWAKVQAGNATPWRAARIATACLDLSHDTAAAVDRRLARIVDTVTPHRLDTIVKAAKAHADPATARAQAEQQARERGVYVARSDDHGTKTIYIRAATGDVIRFDATIASIAEALKALGDTTNQHTRRAKAIGIIADPAYTEQLLLQARNACRSPQPPVDPPVDDEADRDAPHPRHTDLPDPLDTPPGDPVETVWPDPHVDPDAGEPLTPDAQRALNTRLARIKHDAHSHPPAARSNPPAAHGNAHGDDPTGHAHAADAAPTAAPRLPRRRARCPRRTARDRPRRRARMPDGDAHAAHGNAGDSGAGAARSNPDGARRNPSGGRLRPGKTEIYVHLTDHTLATGTGVLRVEGIGPLLATQLSELVGHGPYVVKPVIDLNDAISVDAYEIPDRIRERIKLTHPIELFPYGNRETHHTIDLDHIQPYHPLGPPGQTNTTNLAPLGRRSHRVKTHAPGWNARRLDQTTLEWTTPHGFTYHVTPTGTTRTNHPDPDNPP